MADEKTKNLFSGVHFQDNGQMRLIDVKGAVPFGETMLPLQQTQVAFTDQGRSDASMLAEMNQNRANSEAFIASRGLIGRWNMSEIMLRAWVEPIKWKGSDQFRSHLGVPLVAEQFYAIHSTVNQSLLGGYKVFQIDATSGTPLDAAEAQMAIIQTELKTCGYKNVSLKTEFREITFDGLFYGFGIGHYGWEYIKKPVIKKRYKQTVQTISAGGNLVEIPDEQLDEVEDYIAGYVEYNKPKLEHVPIRRFRYAPDLRRGDPRVATWCGRIIYKTGYELDAMRNTPGWKIPTREELVKLTTPQMQTESDTNPMETLGSNTGNPVFQQTTTPQKALPENYNEQQSDPLARKYELFDYWTDTRHSIALNKEYTILNETHDFGRPPFLGFVFRSAPDSAQGYGIAYWLTDFQRVCQGVVNAFLDDLNLNLMGTYSAPAGTNNTAQAMWIFPGKIFKSDATGPNGGKIEAMQRNAISANEPLAVIAQIKQWAASISGAGPSILGANPGAAGDMRNPDGVEAITRGEDIKLQDLVDVISEQVLIPFLEFCVEKNKQLKPSQIKAILSEELGTAFRATPLDVINGNYRVDISAANRLAARMAIGRSMGLIQSFLQSPGTVENLAVQAMKIDYNAMFTAMFDSFSVPYKEKIIVPMTDEDQQRMMMQTQAAALAGKAGLIHTQAEEKRKTDDNQAENRMLLQTGKHVLDSKSQSDAQQHDVNMAQLQQQFDKTPEAQGLDRAARMGFEHADTEAFGGK